MSGRDYDSIIKARRDALNKQTKNEVLSFPDGYIHGGDFSLNAQKNVVIAPVIASVAGREVRVQVEKVLTGEDWEVPKIKERWYYVYLNIGGTVFVDSIQPVFRGSYMAEYHPNLDSRYLGKFYLNKFGKTANLTQREPVLATKIDAQSIKAKDLVINDTDPYKDDEELPSGDELYDFATPDCKSNKGRNPYLKRSIFFSAGKVGVTDSPYKKWDNRGVVGMFRDFTNLIATDDLDDSTEWDHSASYHSNQENKYDPALDYTVWYWERGTTTDRTFIYDTSIDPGGAGLYYAGIWFKAEEACTVEFYIHFGGSTEESSPHSYDPSEGWVWMEWWHTFTNDPTGVGWIIVSDAANFSAGSWFRACCPIVLNDHRARAPFRFPANEWSQLSYRYDWTTAGTAEIWVLPKIKYNPPVAYNTYVIADYEGTQYSIILYYEHFFGRWRFSVSDGPNTITINASGGGSDAAVQQWTHLKVVWDIPNGFYGIWKNGVLTDSSNSAALTEANFLDRNSGILSVGGIPEYTTTPEEYAYEGFFTDLRIAEYVDKSTTHYENGRPYFDPEELVTGDGQSVRINPKGIRMHNNSLTVTDNFSRFIEISNAKGLYAEDASGTIIHDIPDAKILSDMRFGGHLLWKDTPNYITNLGASYTDNQVSRTVTFSLTNIDISSYIPPGLTNVKGALIYVDTIASVETLKTTADMKINTWIRYGIKYNVVSTYGAIMYFQIEGCANAGELVNVGKGAQAVVPVVYNNGTPYIVLQDHFDIRWMNAVSDDYSIFHFIYLSGFFV